MRLITAGLVLLALGASAETPSPTRGPVRRPRVGLVLSGGGARGTAHVGVLKVLEELRIPADCIAGTSMGSAVGGLYASGLSAGELQEFVNNFDWLEAFNDAPPRGDLSFRRKQDDLTYLVNYRLGVRDGKVMLPLGAVTGQVFTTELRKLGHVTQVLSSFDDLPTPYRAVASDLVTGQEVVLSSGDLALAIRASVSIPPLFTPVEYQGRLLIDGGYLDNLPVEVARSMGCDRLIVVDIGTHLSPRKDINSVFDVLAQAGRLGGTVFDQQQVAHMTSKDLLIVPDLEGYSFVDFGRIPEMVTRGEKAARAVADKLKAFSVSEEEYAAWKARRLKGPKGAPVIDAIRIRNTTKLADTFILRMIRQPLGRPLDPAQLQTDLRRVNGVGIFESLDYNVVSEGGRNILVINAPRRTWGPGYLRFGLQLENDFQADSRWAFGGRYTRTDMNSRGGELQVNAQVGTDSLIGAEFHQPLDYQSKLGGYGSSFFVAPRAGYWRRLRSITDNGGTVNATQQYRVKESEVAFDVGEYLSNAAMLRLGLSRTWNDADPVIGGGVPDVAVHWNDTALSGRVVVDTLDSPAFTRNGVFSRLELASSREDLGSDRPNRRVDATAWGFKSFGRHTFGLKGVFSTNLVPQTSTPYIFTLGGFLNLSGIPPQGLFGSNRALTQARYYWNPASLGGMPFYVGLAEEWGGTWRGRSDIALNSGFVAHTAFVGLRTPLGPMYLGYSRASHANLAATFYLGHLF